MELNVKNESYEPPAREWPGYEYELYFDEVVTALQSYVPAVENQEAANTATEVARLLSGKAVEDARALAEKIEGTAIEVEGRKYQLAQLCGAGEDGVYFHASSEGQSGVLKISWPFDPAKATDGGLDALRIESALLERQAMLEIAHGPQLLSFDAPYILPRLFADGIIVVEEGEGRLCASTLFMEYIEAQSFAEFMAESSKDNTLSDFVEVALGALNAQFYLAELGDQEDAQRGVFRMDNGVHNLLVQRNERGVVAVCLDFGSTAIPAFTGITGNPGLSMDENRELKLNLSVEQLRRALAKALESSEIEHEKTADVLALLDQSGRTNPRELFEALKNTHQEITIAERMSSPLADAETIRLPKLASFTLKGTKGKAA
jgi:hypothetical protein